MTVLNQWVAIVRVKVNLTITPYHTRIETGLRNCWAYTPPNLVIIGDSCIKLGDFGDDHTKHVDQLLSFDLLLLEVVKEPSQGVRPALVHARHALFQVAHQVVYFTQVLLGEVLEEVKVVLRFKDLIGVVLLAQHATHSLDHAAVSSCGVSKCHIISELLACFAIFITSCFVLAYAILGITAR